MNNTIKHAVIDIEADASISQCQMLYPEGNHFDRHSIPWCITIAINNNCHTLVCKLPDKVREYLVDDKPTGIFTKNYHLKSTIVPTRHNDIYL